MLLGAAAQQEDLGAADERTVDGEKRIFRRRAEQADGAAFHVGQQGILLGAVKAVDFVDEEDGARVRTQPQTVFGGGDHAADVQQRQRRSKWHR